MAYIGNTPKNTQRGRRETYKFTSTASQTTYSGVDDNSNTLDLVAPNQQAVYLNGVRLVYTEDYTVSGDVLTLTTAASLNDILIIDTHTEVVNQTLTTITSGGGGGITTGKAIAMAMVFG